MAGGLRDRDGARGLHVVVVAMVMVPVVVLGDLIEQALGILFAASVYRTRQRRRRASDTKQLFASY
jgi:hypothetical protein